MDKNAVSVNADRPTEAKLRKSEARDYAPLLSWFTSKHEFTQWAGPSLELAKSPQALASAIEKGNYQSFSLYNPSNNDLLGFGQIQLWPSRGHLGRLVISPQHRGKGLSYKLVNLLIEQASEQQAIKTFSLFVYKHNTAALKSYENLGFVPTAYPKGIEKIENCLFMTMLY